MLREKARIMGSQSRGRAEGGAAEKRERAWWRQPQERRAARVRSLA